MPTTDRYPVTQKYLMTRGQAINFPSQFFQDGFKGFEVFGVVIDIPMPSNVLTTMVCCINGASNLSFNNGNEYTGASMKYRNLVQETHNMVANAKILLPKCERVHSYDLPKGRTQNVFLLTKRGIYKTVYTPGVIPESEPEKRTFYVLYQRVLKELRNCQLKDDAERRKASK